jgi:hypothetical protein
METLQTTFSNEEHPFRTVEIDSEKYLADKIDEVIKLIQDGYDIQVNCNIDEDDCTLAYIFDNIKAFGSDNSDHVLISVPDAHYSAFLIIDRQHMKSKGIEVGARNEAVPEMEILDIF